ncbi:MAG: 4-hydroxythreonine-4-phosphate dehydrogenase PdxA, partial [Hyphomicrobiales bacterium]|nr:4-hydroxythreonine-4-phosphate dehydrogenase PdxA [Hyphomicrobiales bacterium]
MAPPLALTLGDPAGIGPEIALKRWLARKDGDPAFFLLADPDATSRAARALGFDAPLARVAPEEAAGAFARALPVVPLGVAYEGAPGRPSRADAAATVESIRRAVALVREGRAGAIVTNPIAKKPLYEAGFPHPGHTEYLGAL